MSQLVVYGGSGLSNLDSKGRMTMPSELRSCVEQSSSGNIVCLARHAEYPCLIGFGKAERNKIRTDIEKQWESALNRGEDFNREQPSSSIYDIPFEQSGRFVIQPMLKFFGKLEDKAFFFGTTTHFMIWNPDIFLADTPSGYNQVREELLFWIDQAERKGK
ncbi:hypothetical protein LPB140_09465 [Sphingorhabdus lutea]|uniref:Division/cell wall cluster transcriptional repressor MraZ n=1 Tax=Sphingorhabdus lutea TaxID=1913578 RepID=A0A1L3JCY1_9SPHN|nr:hypothetical protein [Sphingorhabdus lutea]APG62980.1 hypothetical protein LPB140_09465 [Sphingorhabdus lutea]